MIGGAQALFERCPDMKGIKTAPRSLPIKIAGFERCPDMKGIKTYCGFKGDLRDLFERCPDMKGIKTVNTVKRIARAWRSNAALI